MARRRWVGATMLALAAVIGMPAVALGASPAPSPSAVSSATTYQAVNVSLVVSAASIAVGGHVTVSGSGFGADEPVDLTVTYGPPSKADGNGTDHAQTAAYAVVNASSVTQVVAAEVDADSHGSFTHELVLSQTGMVAITATGTISQRSSSSTVDVLAHSIGGTTAASSAHSTFFSGSHLTLLAAVPVFLLLGGLLFAGRHKLLIHRDVDTTPAGSQPVAHEPFTVS